jgi:hypothetical protein
VLALVQAEFVNIILVHQCLNVTIQPLALLVFAELKMKNVSLSLHLDALFQLASQLLAQERCIVLAIREDGRRFLIKKVTYRNN